jgi:AbrB family looped-hinge helix DNA binding protein
MSSVVGTKGQVTIEKAIRDALGIAPGWRAVQRVEGNQVILEFLPPKHRRSLAGILKGATSVRMPPGEGFEEMVEKAWADSVGERREPGE